MISLWRSLTAEVLKLKRTLALWMVFIAPLAIAGFIFAVTLSRELNDASPDPWDQFSSIVLTLWGLLMLPLFVALEMALLGGLESTEKQWKHLFVLAIPRPALYGAKLLVGLGLIGLSTLVLWGGMLAAGWGLRWLRPDLGFAAPAPWLSMLQAVGRTYLAAWLVLALHLWLSLRWQSITLALGIGMTATVLGAFLIRSARWSPWYPWVLPGVTLLGTPSGQAQALLLGGIGGLVAALLGCWDVVRRDVL